MFIKEWHYCDGRNGRAEFTSELAEPAVQKIFKGKRIPEKYRKKGQASPFLYCKTDKEYEQSIVDGFSFVNSGTKLYQMLCFYT